jgi:glycerol-3-phosphate acyltransferase PlsY
LSPRETIIQADAPDRRNEKLDDRKKNLASALSGSAVGPVFPRYFAMQAVCGVLALITALSWWRTKGKVHRWRVYIIALAVLTVAIGWPISNYVSELRLLRFVPDQAIAEKAKADFVTWHLVSLFLSFVTVSLAGAALALASRLPVEVVASDGRKDLEVDETLTKTQG